MRINEPQTKRPRPVVLVVCILISLALITVWFRESETGPLHRVRIGVHAIAAPFSAVGGFVTAPVRGFFAWTSDLGVSRSQLERLRSQNERLRTRVAELEEERLENIRLRRLVRLSQARELKSLAARVIGRPTNSWEGVITIDRGTNDGLRNGMPVVGPRGLLGQTIDVGPGSARVRLITDQQSGVAGQVQRTRALGVVRGTVEGGLSLQYVSRETTVSAGDVVITSGLGGVFPKGLVIGEVTEVDRGQALYQDIRVQPAGTVSDLEEVLVLLTEESTPAPEGGE